MVVVSRPEGGTALDRARETYPASGTLKHAGLTGFQLTAGASGLTIAEVEGPDNAADFAGLALTAGQELVFGQPITMLKLSAGDGVVYNSAQRPAQWFVSSVNGDDTNTGFTSSLQLRTIGKLMEFQIAAGDEIILDDDSVWREQLNVPSDTTVTRSNTGTNRPLLDGADQVVNNLFNLSSDQTNTYQANWVPDYGDGTKDRITLYEDGSLLIRQTSIANVEANAGSFYIDGFADTAGNIIYVHPKGSTNPIVDGKLYEATRRETCINGLLSNGVTVNGIHTRRSVINNGSVQLNLNTRIENCLIEYGTAHNWYVGSGSVVNTITRYNDDNLGGTASICVFFANDATGLSGTVTGGSIEGGNPDNSDVPLVTDAIYAHSNTPGTNLHTKITLDGVAIRKVNNPFVGDVEILEAVRCSCTNIRGYGFGELVTLVNDCFFSSSISGNKINIPTAGRYTARGTRFYEGGQNSNIFFTNSRTNITVDIQECSFEYIGGGFISSIFWFNGATGLNLTYKNNVERGYSNVLNHIGGTLPTIDFEDNVYELPSGNPAFIWNGTTYNFANWQSTAPPGEDQNSVEVDPVYTDPVNDDFTTTAPEVDTLQAGVEYYVAS